MAIVSGRCMLNGVVHPTWCSRIRTFISVPQHAPRRTLGARLCASLVGGSPCCLHPVHVVPWLSASAGSQNAQPSVFSLSLSVTHSLLLFSHHALSAGSLLSLSVGPLPSLSVGYLMPLPVKHRLPLSLSVISCHSLLVDPSMSSTTGPWPLPRS